MIRIPLHITKELNLYRKAEKNLLTKEKKIPIVKKLLKKLMCFHIVCARY